MGSSHGGGGRSGTAILAATAAMVVAGCGAAALRAPPTPAPPFGARLLALPTLLTGHLYTPQQVCAHARRRAPDRRLALVALKSHVCDRGAQVCLRATRDLADRCNAFVRAGFALYHTRLYRNSPDGRHEMVEDAVAWEIMTAWSSSGPTVFVLDTEPCVVLGQVGPGLPGLGGHDAAAAPTPTSERFRLLREALLAVPGVAERLPAAALRAAAEPGCLAAPEPTVGETWEALERQVQ